MARSCASTAWTPNVVDSNEKAAPACPDCFWAAWGVTTPPNPLLEWSCNAPGVLEMLEADCEFTFTAYAREFKTVCGAAGRFFVRRREGNGYINACLRDNNYDELPDVLREKAGQ